MSVVDTLSDIKRRVGEELKELDGSAALENLRVRVLGKKGELTALLKGMGQLAPEERPRVGAQINEVRQWLTERMDEAQARIRAAERLHVTQHAVHDSLVLFGSAIYYRETIPETLRFVEALLPNCLDFRRGGSAALDCCYVTAGRADLFFECRLCPWDYAAGGLIVTEAGGIATQLDGSPLALTQRGSVAMGNAVNHPELLAIARRIREGGDA